MGLEALLDKLEARSVTPVTAAAIIDVTGKPAKTLGCTSVTPVTAENIITGIPDVLQNGDGKISAEQSKADDWQEFYDERAGVAKHCGHMHLYKAEAQAYDSCMTRWLDTNPPTHNDDSTCPHCLRPNGRPGEDAIPTLTGNGSYLWLHHSCLESWQARRRQDAIMALADMGILFCATHTLEENEQ